MSLHFGHRGRDATLSIIEDISWPRIHREVVDRARFCEQCGKPGKNITSRERTQVGAIFKARKVSKTTFYTTGDNKISRKTKN